jgi:hypothetical protein
MNSISAKPTASRFFPLNFTPFEDYMVWDDRKDYPMTFVVEFEFRGSVDRDALEAALPEALERHPLLQAWTGRAKGNREGWIAAGNGTVKIDWGDLGSPIELSQGEPIDLSREVGLRVWVRYDANRTILTTQFHHATCDGIGSYQFLGDWLWFYAKRVGQPIEEPLPNIDLKGVRARAKACYDIEAFRKPNGKIPLQVDEMRYFLLDSMIPVAPPKIRASRATFPGICSFEFDKDEYKRIRHVAEERGQSTNELLIERLMQAVKLWNTQQGKSSSKSFAVMMPMDLREPGDPNFSAANIVTYAFIRRPSRMLAETEKLIDSLREEMVHLKHKRHRSAFMNMMKNIYGVPRWLKRRLLGNRCMATAIVSNTGDPTKRFLVAFPREGNLIRCGNLILEDVRGVPPMRVGTRATVSVFTYRRILKLCLRCDPNFFDVANTQQILDLYRDQIRALL